jgi:hypothetical protein
VPVLRQNLVRHPNDHDTLIALINFNRDAGNFTHALIYAEQQAALAPDDQELAKLILNLRQQVK